MGEQGVSAWSAKPPELHLCHPAPTPARAVSSAGESCAGQRAKVSLTSSTELGLGGDPRQGDGGLLSVSWVLARRAPTSHEARPVEQGAAPGLPYSGQTWGLSRCCPIPSQRRPGASVLRAEPKEDRASYALARPEAWASPPGQWRGACIAYCAVVMPLSPAPGDLLGPFARTERGSAGGAGASSFLPWASPRPLTQLCQARDGQESLPGESRKQEGKTLP